MPSLRRTRAAVALLALLATLIPLAAHAAPTSIARTGLPFSRPTSLHGLEATATSLLVAWDGPRRAPKYRLELSTDRFQRDIRPKWTVHERFVLRDLEPDTRYWVRVRVVNGQYALSRFSRTVVLRTAAAKTPPVPESPPQPGSGPTLFGANYADVAGVDETLYAGRAEAARIFFQGLGGKTWSQHGAVREATADGISTFVISWKERDPQRVRAFLATIPDGLRVYAAFHHEPENDVSVPGTAAYDEWAAEWRHQWTVQSPLIRAEGFVPTSILMAWTANPRSGRDLADWTPPEGTVDVFAFDGYLDHDTAAAQVDRMVRAAAAAGFERTGLAETGASVHDPDRLAKFRAMRQAVLGSGRFEWALYWNSALNGYDSRLDEPTADAWFG